MNDNIDTLTPEELSTKIAEMMGWKKERQKLPHSFGGHKDWWVDAKGNRIMIAYQWTPNLNWHHWGIVYEWMVGRGWKDEHTHTEIITRGSVIRWTWRKSEHPIWGYTYVEDPDLRTAMLKAAWKAEGMK